MHGTADENAVLRAFSAKPFAKFVFECGMIAKADLPWMACSPDGLAIIETSKIAGYSLTAESDEVIASIEIKKSIDDST